MTVPNDTPRGAAGENPRPTGASSSDACPDVEALVRLFHPRLADLGAFRAVAAAELPDAARQLLVHQYHMTVTVEAFHRSPVNVMVLNRHVTPTHYAREILLARQSDGRIVQYGIMRVALDCLEPTVRAKIESQAAPLGRILIEHNVLRSVELCSLWRVAPGPALTRHLPPGAAGELYGRTALIHVNGQPAVELLEIVV